MGPLERAAHPALHPSAGALPFVAGLISLCKYADAFVIMFSPKMGRNDINKISKIPGKLPSMHGRLE